MMEAPENRLGTGLRQCDTSTGPSALGAAGSAGAWGSASVQQQWRVGRSLLPGLVAAPSQCAWGAGSLSPSDLHGEAVSTADLSCYLQDPDFAYQDFARRDEDHTQIFRVQVSTGTRRWDQPGAGRAVCVHRAVRASRRWHQALGLAAVTRKASPFHRVG